MSRAPYAEDDASSVTTASDLSDAPLQSPHIFSVGNDEADDAIPLQRLDAGSPIRLPSVRSRVGLCNAESVVSSMTTPPYGMPIVLGMMLSFALLVGLIPWLATSSG